MPPPLSSLHGCPSASRATDAPPTRRNVAVVSHAQYVLTVTAAPASHVKAMVSKATLTFDLLTMKVVSESRVTRHTWLGHHFHGQKVKV